MTERKYRKPVNVNGWMRKVQKFAFGKSTPRFVGYCPFFWFTWMSLLILPVIIPFKLVRLLFRGVGMAGGAALSCLPDKPISKPPTALLIDFYEAVLNQGLCNILEANANNPELERLIAWLRVTPDWENCAKRAIIKRDIAASKQAIRMKRVKAFSNYGAPIAKTALIATGTILSVVAIYEFQRLIIHIQWFRAWNTFVAALPIMGMIALVSTGIFLVGWLIIFAILSIVARFRRCPKCPDRVTIWMKVGRIIGATFEFAFETIENIYTQECPLIEWGDKDEPIQRR